MAMSRLIAAKDTLGLKMETTSGTAATLAAADYGIGARNISYSPTVGHYMRALTTGDYSKFTSVAGKQSGTVSFECDLTPGGAAASYSTPPRWFTAMRCCCMNQTGYTAGVRVITDATQDQNTCTIEICKRQEGASPNQLVVQLVGCAGDWEIDCSNVGEPAKVKFTFHGRINSVSTRAFGSILAPTSFDTQAPPAVLSATIQLYSTTQYITKFNIKANNKVEGFTNPGNATGYDYFRVVDREPSAELDPDQFITTDIDLYANEKNDTTGVLSIAFGAGITLYAPVAQIEDAKPAEREGHHAQSIKLGLKRSSGNDEFKILQGVES